MGSAGKLSRIVPKRRETVVFTWIGSKFLTMNDSYRAARKRMSNPLDRCWWCKEPFGDGDPIAVAGRKKGKNVVLCEACASLARQGVEGG